MLSTASAYSSTSDTSDAGVMLKRFYIHSHVYTHIYPPNAHTHVHTQYPEVVGDRKLLRFLRGHDFNITKVTEMLQKHLQWRKDNHVDEIRYIYVHKHIHIYTYMYAYANI